MPKHRYILGIDPGNKQSAFCLVETDGLRPLVFEKTDNSEFIEKCVKAIIGFGDLADTQIVIENMESFGMSVGRSVLDTCIYIGELKMFFELSDMDVAFVFRHEEKMIICHSMKANDATIKQALIDRFAPDTSNHGKGTKANKGFFYGFSNDVWSSYAQAVTFHDREYGNDLHLEELPF